MAFDFKKEYRDLYVPGVRPAFVNVPAMTFAAVAGTGDPNEEGGAYQRALGLLYGFSYTVKMSKMGPWQPEGYFDFVVPPLEGLWWAGLAYSTARRSATRRRFRGCRSSVSQIS